MEGKLFRNIKERRVYFKKGIFSAVLLQIKTFVLYPHYYDQEVLHEEVQIFFKAWFLLAFIGQLYSYFCPEAPNGRVKYVAHGASCNLRNAGRK